MEVFGLRWALLNGYEEIVNGSLIHANRLAFGWTEGYLCIEAAPGQMVSHLLGMNDRKKRVAKM